MSEACSMCGESFGGPADLLAHMKSAHALDDGTTSLKTNPEAERPGYVCTLCARRFSSPEKLAAHALYPHIRNEPPGWCRPSSA